MIKIRLFTILQFLIKCFIVVGIIDLSVNGLLKIPIVNEGFFYVVNKLNWTNYGVWFWHLIGTVIALIWQTVYDYRIKKKSKEKQITTFGV